MTKRNYMMYFGVSAALILAVIIFGLPVETRSADDGSASGSGNIAKGKTIFEDQCISCHTIGGGRENGPDLKGVTEQRPHEWLVKFIKNPGKMFNENDPTAEKILKEYAGVEMPGLGLSEAQINDVLAYIKQQSRQ